MGMRIISTAALLFVLVSCTAVGENSATTAADTEPSTTSTTAPLPTDPGRLAILDGTGNIIVADPDGTHTEAITDSEGEPSIYTQPIWSPDGSTLAWGQATGTGFGAGFSQPGSGEITTLTTPNLPFYTYWSPDNRHLGLLHNGNSGVQFQIVDLDEESTSVLDEDAPFYFSWSPEGDAVVIHAGPTRAETIRPDGERTELEPTSAGYLAPQWTAHGVFHVVDDRLIVEDETGDRETVAVVSGITMFVANRQGSSVALQSTSDGPGPVTAAAADPPVIAANAVSVIDVNTGNVETISEALSAGFFWSPDGESLLVLTTSPGEIVPLVWTGDGPTEFRGFSPSPPMVRDTFPFFPQYAQSVNFWSPDSKAFAYAGEVNEDAGIWVQEVDGDEPLRVSDGSWVAWSGPMP
jgi:TolB protein